MLLGVIRCNRRLIHMPVHFCNCKIYLNKNFINNQTSSLKLCFSYHQTNYFSSAPLENELKLAKNKLNLKPKVADDWGDIVARWYKQYQNFVGISEIIEAQEKVSMLTNQLLEVQIRRRQLQRDVEEVHQQLLATHQRITKAELYSEDHYSLFEKARQLNGSLKTLQAQFIQTEEEERSIFTQLSNAIKYCHEKERAQSEQSKYWSILISVISATLAALITSINNWVRIKEIKDHASVLHKDVISKANELQAVFMSNLTTSSLSNPILPLPTSSTSDSTESSQPQETLLHSIQKVIQDELKLFSSRTDIKESDSKNQEQYQEVSYVKIAGSMLSGALIGVVITYNILGSSGGGG